MNDFGIRIIGAPEISEEERLANTIAAEILLPFGAMNCAIENERITCNLMRAIAARFEVSRRAVLRRITDLRNSTLIYITAVPDRFRHLESHAVIDSALYVVPNEGLVMERGPVHFLRRISFQKLVASRSVRVGINGTRGRVITDFDRSWSMRSNSKRGTSRSRCQLPSYMRSSKGNRSREMCVPLRFMRSSQDGSTRLNYEKAHESD